VFILCKASAFEKYCLISIKQQIYCSAVEEVRSPALNIKSTLTVKSGNAIGATS
jgi:hypothetical protein